MIMRSILVSLVLSPFSFARVNHHQNDQKEFQPALNHRTYRTVPNRSLTSSLINAGGTSDPVEISKAYLRLQLGLQLTRDYVVRDVVSSHHNGVTHVYLRQMVDGREVYNGDININIASDGRVISVGNSFYDWKAKGKSLTAGHAFPKSTIPAAKAVEALLGRLELVPSGASITMRISEWRGLQGGQGEIKKIRLTEVPEVISDAQAQLGWLQLGDGTLEPVWDLKIEMKRDHYHGHISAVTGKPLSIINWASRASYRVIPFGTNDPTEGDRQLISDPADRLASPHGWHELDGKQGTTTGGNNVFAVKVTAYDPSELEPEARVDGGEDLIFDFSFNDTDPDPRTYQSAAVTNLFYYNNMLHDLYFRYGFDEAAGNFQQINFNLERKGLGGDAVIANAQDPFFTNDAFFICPPDGQNARMQILLFDETQPAKDGDFDSGIIIHEYTHGLSTRLTGGPSNSDCLGYGEPGGLGEGWGDAIATMIRMKEQDTRNTNKALGSYVLPTQPTLRNYLYSTNMTTNPLTYDYLNQPKYKEVHNIGEVWASMLYEVYWNLRDKLGYTKDWSTNGGGVKEQTKFGNTLLLRLLIDAMKLQPCHPTFISARDALLQAELVLTNNAHTCDVWAGFAKRGLGFKATASVQNGTTVYVSSFELPKECIHRCLS